MRLSQWARRLGDFLGIEPEDSDPPGQSPPEPEPPSSDDGSAAPDDQPTAEVTDHPSAPARRRLKAVQGPGSDEELADLRDIVQELQEHVDAEDE